MLYHTHFAAVCKVVRRRRRIRRREEWKQDGDGGAGDTFQTNAQLQHT